MLAIRVFFSGLQRRNTSANHSLILWPRPTSSHAMMSEKKAEYDRKPPVKLWSSSPMSPEYATPTNTPNAPTAYTRNRNLRGTSGNKTGTQKNTAISQRNRTSRLSLGKALIAYQEPTMQNAKIVATINRALALPLHSRHSHLRRCSRAIQCSTLSSSSRLSFTLTSHGRPWGSDSEYYNLPPLGESAVGLTNALGGVPYGLADARKDSMRSREPHSSCEAAVPQLRLFFERVGWAPPADSCRWNVSEIWWAEPTLRCCDLVAKIRQGEP